MNMKKIQVQHETYYFANYKEYHTPVAISNVRDLVKEYMETHRSVSPKDYTITEGDFALGEIQLDFPYSLIEEYENWYIPSVDIEMIELNKDKVENIINDTVEGIKTILIFTQDIKKVSQKDRDILTRSMCIINEFRNKRKIWDKIVDNFKLSDLLFTDMETYWNSRCMYIDMKETRQKWDFMIENKGGDKNEE